MRNSLKKLCAALLTVVMLLPMLLINMQAATYVWPLDNDLNYITSYAGNRIHPLTGQRQNHSGIDIRASKGSDVYATASGVAYIGCNWCSHNYGKSKSCGCGGGYGNYVYIVHSTGMVSYYAHLTSVRVNDGEFVYQGQRIGTSGSTGSSTGFHLHFEMRTSTDRDDRVDPLDYVSIPGEEDFTPDIPEETTPNGSTGLPSNFNPNVIDFYDPFAGSSSVQTPPSNVIDSTTPSTTQKAGTIDITLTSYPTALDKGKSCNLKGTVSANDDLTRVSGSILSASGATVQTVVVYPDDDSLNIYKSNINKKLRFGSLSDGTYTLRIDASAEDGSTGTWERTFTVGDAQVVIPEENGSAGASSAIEFDITRYPISIDKGDSYSLRGTISSSARISSLRGYILDEDGDEVQSTSETPNAKSVNVKSARVNQKLAFGKLSRGTYTLKMVAVDKDGNIGTWEKTFVVD